MKVRPNRIGEEIKKEVVLLIRNGIKDPRVDSLVSITDVEVTRDLSYATIYISRYGTEQQRQDALEGMQAAARFIRSELSRRLKLRTVPELILSWMILWNMVQKSRRFYIRSMRRNSSKGTAVEDMLYRGKKDAAGNGAIEGCPAQPKVCRYLFT